MGNTGALLQDLNKNHGIEIINPEKSLTQRSVVSFSVSNISLF
jgi:hypothetical protein